MEKLKVNRKARRYRGFFQKRGRHVMRGQGLAGIRDKLSQWGAEAGVLVGKDLLKKQGRNVGRRASHEE